VRIPHPVLAVLVALILAASALAQQRAVNMVNERPVDRAKKRVEQLQILDEEETIHKIVGGKVAPSGKFPFQVALIWSGTPVNREYYGQFCGGTLIANSWVLTAAHCVVGTTEDEVDIYIGAQILPKQAPATGDRVHTVRVLAHKFYSKASKDNDIALLKLANPPPNSTAAMVASSEIPKPIGLVDTNLTVIGWGATGQGGSAQSALREVDVTVRDSRLCQQNYQSVVPGAAITPNMFCAGQVEGGKDSCQGDSGGFIGAPFGKGWVVMGVVSWGLGCAKPNLFGVYTRVSNYVTWIANTIRSN
jgi:secreted trypsin-like serine protease